MTAHNIILNKMASPGKSMPIVEVRQGEAGAESIVATICDGSGSELADLTGCTAKFCCITPNGNVIEDDDVLVSGTKLTYKMSKYVTAFAGVIHVAYFLITEPGTFDDPADATNATDGLQIRVVPGILSVAPGDYVPELEEMKNEFWQYLNAIKRSNETSAIPGIRIEDESITGGKIADNAISSDKLSQSLRDSLSRTPKAVKESTGAYYAWIDIPLDGLTLRIGFHGTRGLLILTRFGSGSWHQEYPST